MEKYLPEGRLYEAAGRRCTLRSSAQLTAAALNQTAAEAVALRLDAHGNLLFELNGTAGIMPASNADCRIPPEKLQAVLSSLVGRPLCFYISSVNGERAMLSRAAAQNDCLQNYINLLTPGDIIPGRVRAMQPFGAFIDVGRGITALLPTRAICDSRIEHPSQIFSRGQDIFCAVSGFDESGRMLLTHRRLLGDYETNALRFSAGETAAGTVRAVEGYGVFVELAPNLTGLAEPFEGLKVGDAVSVYIKSIFPQRRKIKLAVISRLDGPLPLPRLDYIATEGKAEL